MEDSEGAEQERALNPMSLCPPGPCRDLEKGYITPETKAP